jgi:FtsP/CotA-like multicopper oxidase with cupredoxin domain
LITDGTGQRYDVVIEANQPTANYYFRIGTGGGVCDGPNEQATAGNSKGAIISYEGADSSEPSSTPLALPSGCYDETNIVPIIQYTVPSPPSPPVTMNLTLDTSAGVFWKVNGVAMDINWEVPTMDYIINGTYNSLPPSDNAVLINTDGWVYYLIVNETPLPHPIHLHGHDFWVISFGKGDGTGASYNSTNPLRRDTHSVEGNNGTPGAGGYMVIAFQADNPGAWLLHCHIPFHISGGLGVQFLERPSEIYGTLGDMSGYQEGCATWRGLQKSVSSIAQPDSGLKRKRARKVRRRT